MTDYRIHQDRLSTERNLPTKLVGEMLFGLDIDPEEEVYKDCEGNNA